MANRVQALVLGLGKAKQADILTASASYLRFTKNNMDLTSIGLEFEDDAAEIGKGDEFATNTFPVSYSPSNRVEKFSSAEFLTWALAYGLGNVAEASNVYTLVPIDPGTTIELPYFSIVEQVAEGGGSAIDNLFYGCAINEVGLSVKNVPGRSSATVSVGWMGSGKILTPSSVTVPAVTTEHYMPGASAALSIIGVDYVATPAKIDSVDITLANNLKRLFNPGSGTQDGASLSSALEIMNRVYTAGFKARLLATSTEITKLKAQTTGTFVLTLTFDSTHTVAITFQKVAYKVASYVDADGMVAIQGNMSVQRHATNGVLSVTAKCGITGIAQ